tara:strand:+ start:367 stop:636 length:270 start_codon:yes stop_codon:yes gene_type:complete
MNVFKVLNDRYSEKILGYDTTATPIEDPKNPTSTHHLLWMLSEISSNRKMAEAKKHRWLGFIQGVLRCQWVIDVNEERDFTRPLFKGEE